MSSNQHAGIIVFIVALVAVYGLIGGPIISNKSNNSSSSVKTTPQENTFKNEVLTMIDASSITYSYASMMGDIDENYFTSSDDDEYAGFCVTLEALVKNGYLQKDITNYGGVFLIEVPYDGGVTYYTSWVHNGKLGVNGVEKNMINRLQLNEKSTGNDIVSGGKLELTNDLRGIKELINQVKYNSSITITSPSSKGGTGSTYSNMKCVTDKIS